MIVYELQIYIPNNQHICKDFDKLETAMLAGEHHPWAQIITWNEHPNLPNALPSTVRSSCALRVWNNKEWKMVNIF